MRRSLIRMLIASAAAFVTLNGMAQPEAVVVDRWDDALRCGFYATSTEAVLKDIPRRQDPRFRLPGIVLDHVEAQAGDFALRLEPSRAATHFGMLAGVWGSRWTLPDNGRLHIRTRLPEGDDTEWHLVLADENGREARTRQPIKVTPGSWQAIDISLHDFDRAVAFDPEGVTLIALVASRALTGPVWLDDVWIADSDGGRVHGITEISVARCIKQEQSTREARVRAAIASGARHDFSGRDRQLYDQLWLGENVAEANATLRELYRTELTMCRNGRADLWSLAMNPRLIYAYYRLGSPSAFAPPRLEAETEALLLELLWERLKDKNDIALAAWDTWWLTGSENHDLNFKASCLVSSRIFMEHPDYRDRIYPDAGYGAGHGYWFHQMYQGARGYGPEGSATLKDGRNYTARDHYNAWRDHFMRYFAARARNGFFVERAADGYMKWTLCFVQLVHDFSGDAALKKRTRDFLDLVWMDWAQEQIDGLRGGFKVRFHHQAEESMTTLAKFLGGGPFTTSHIYMLPLTSDYEWPREVWELAFGRCDLGCYAVYSRGVGEELPLRPRPAGTERTMLVNPDSRLVKVSWVTPDYILGTQMDHPDAIYGHLATGRRWQGLLCGETSEARIVFTSGSKPDKRRNRYWNMDVVSQSVQDRNVLISQQKRRWTQINPEWFPAYPAYEQPVELYIGNAWDTVEEVQGWIALQKRNVYAAIRIVDGNSLVENTPDADQLAGGDPGRIPLSLFPASLGADWTEGRESLRLHNPYAIVIIETGRKADYADLDAFMADVLDNPLYVLPTVVPSFIGVAYRGSQPEAKEIIFPGATPGIPRIDGEPIEYDTPYAFDSPFIRAEFGSGKVHIKGRQSERLLNFAK